MRLGGASTGWWLSLGLGETSGTSERKTENPPIMESDVDVRANHAFQTISGVLSMLGMTRRDLPNLALSPRQISRSTLVENEGYPF